MWPKAPHAPGGCYEGLLVSCLDVQVQHLAVFAFKQTVAGSGVDIGEQVDRLGAASQYYR